jgi:hypothetical protein
MSIVNVKMSPLDSNLLIGTFNILKAPHFKTIKVATPLN